MKIKGFTLVELLAVIVILAIILLIAVPKVNNMIEDVKIETMKKNEDMMVKATKNYLTGNKVALPDNIGDIKEIKLSDLQAANYMGDIESPVNSNTACNGYVLVTKIGSNQYNYEPYLNCYNSNIGSVGYDRLLAHYKFDDFQEPTTNVVTNTDLNTGWSQGYQTAIVFNEIDPPTGLNTPTVGFNRGNSGAYWYSYGDYAPQDPGVTYTVSLYVKTLDSNFRINFYTADNSETGRYSSEYISVPNDGKWHRVVWNSFTNGSTSQSDSLSFNFSYAGAIGDPNTRTWFAAPQMEAKNHVTPYVIGSRTGIVKDYSNNGKNASLSTSTTPQWTTDSKIGKGAYKFDGVDDYIPLPSSMSTMLNGSKFTLSAWTKATSLATGMNLSGIVCLGYGLGTALSSGGSFWGRMDTGSSLPSWSTSGVNLFDNVYHHVAMTYDGTYMRLYVDGVKKTEAATAWSNRYSNAGAIGYEANNPPVYRYYGNIDDVRIYGRALSDDEVGYLYKADK